MLLEELRDSRATKIASAVLPNASETTVAGATVAEGFVAGVHSEKPWASVPKARTRLLICNSACSSPDLAGPRCASKSANSGFITDWIRAACDSAGREWLEQTQPMDS